MKLTPDTIDTFIGSEFAGSIKIADYTFTSSTDVGDDRGDHTVTSIHMSNGVQDTVSLCTVDWSSDVVSLCDGAQYDTTLLDDSDRFTDTLSVVACAYSICRAAEADRDEKNYPVHHEDPIVHAVPRRISNNPSKIGEAAIEPAPEDSSKAVDPRRLASIAMYAFNAFAQLDHASMYRWLQTDCAESACDSLAISWKYTDMDRCLRLDSYTMTDKIDFGKFTQVDLQQLVFCAVHRVLCNYVAMQPSDGGDVPLRSECIELPFLDVYVSANEVTLKYVMQTTVGRGYSIEVQNG